MWERTIKVTDLQLLITPEPPEGQQKTSSAKKKHKKTLDEIVNALNEKIKRKQISRQQDQES